MLVKMNVIRTVAKNKNVNPKCENYMKNMIYEGAANLQKNIETVGGKLKLYSDKLVFEPHAINVQREPVSILLSSVLEIHLGWTKLFGFIPILPNSMIVLTTDNKSYRFTVFRRKEWADKIKSEIEKL